MSLPDDIREEYDVLPDTDRFHRPRPKRWLLLEGNRYSVTSGLLFGVFTTILAVGTIWPFQMRQLLTETDAVQTLLNTMLGGIILLVSIVASISAIVLSYDITSLDAQEERLEAAMRFRRDVGELTPRRGNPTDPSSFLRVMSEVIESRAKELEEMSSGIEGALAEDVQEYTHEVMETLEWLDRSLSDVSHGEFSALWRGLEVDYGAHLNESRGITLEHTGDFTEESREQFDELVRAIELFSTGREYFKTLYYTREVSRLSRTLLLISLPSILITATAILAIDAGILPDAWVFGLPPLLTFVAFVFTAALAPFAVLAAYMLRVATVALKTASAGPFSIAK